MRDQNGTKKNEKPKQNYEQRDQNKTLANNLLLKYFKGEDYILFSSYEKNFFGWKKMS